MAGRGRHQRHVCARAHPEPAWAGCLQEHDPRGRPSSQVICLSCCPFVSLPHTSMQASLGSPSAANGLCCAAVNQGCFRHQMMCAHHREAARVARLRSELGKQEALLRSLGPTLPDAGAKVRACIARLRSELAETLPGVHAPVAGDTPRPLWCVSRVLISMQQSV